MRSGGRLLFLLACSACGQEGKESSPADGAPDSGADDAPETGETGDTRDTAGEDRDGDGASPSAGDCDDSDPSVHPGAPEIGADGTDQDCDGSDFPGTAISGSASRHDGTAARMTFGEVILLEAEAEDPGVVLISETAYLVGEYGGDGGVHIFTAAEAGNTGGAGTVLHHTEDGAMFGRAVGTARMDDGTRAWLVGFSDIVDFGGFCAWDANNTGEMATSTAEACIPPFEDDVNDRADTSFSARSDLNGDGFPDLAIGGMSQEGGERVGALWVTWGPLGFVQLAETPELGLVGFATVPRLHAVGDLDQDGYPDLVLSDESADGLATSSGAVYVIPGGTSLPTSSDALGGVDGDRPSSETGDAAAIPDLDGDGALDLCVSAPLDDTAGERAGRVGCFYAPVIGRVALSDAAVSWVAEEPNSFFGFSMGSIDLDGDGDDELAIGAPDDPYYAHGWPGKIYLVDPVESEPVGLLVGERGDGLGAALGAGDLDGDGRDDLAVGAPWTDGLRGAAYVAFGGGGGW